MTKIKDLVTATVDCAFMIFPIDAERYELGISVLDLIHAKLLYGESAEAINLKDDRIPDFLHTLDDEFRQGALAYANVVEAESRGTCCDYSTVRKYERVKNALPPAAEERCRGLGIFPDTVALVMDTLWLSFFYKLTQRPMH